MKEMRKRTTLLCSACAALLLAAVLALDGAGFSGALRASAAENESAPTTVTYDFTSAEQLNDFATFWSSGGLPSGAESKQFSEHWSHDATAGKVVSTTAHGKNEGWNNIAQLVLTKYRFTNFEAEIAFNHASGSEGGWVGLQFWKAANSSAGRKGGYFAFTQKEGSANLWHEQGEDGYDNNNYEAVAPKDTFDNKVTSLFTVRIVGKDFSVKLTSLDGQTEYAKKEGTLTQDMLPNTGLVSLTSCDDQHEFHSFKITNLNGEGNPIPLDEIIKLNSLTLDKTVSSVKEGETVELGYTLDPASAQDKVDVNWASSDTSVAVVKDGKVTGLKAGTAKITATAAIDASKTDSLDITVNSAEQTSHYFTFEDEAVMSEFTAAYIANSEGGSEEWSEHWAVSDGLLKRVNLPETSSATHDIANLYLNDRLTEYFETTLVYRNSQDKSGWVGITSGTKSYSKRFLDEGLGMFMQIGGEATVWGLGTGDPSADNGTQIATPNYGKTDWHILKVRAYGNTVELYLDNMIEPVLVKSGISLKEGNVGIMTSEVAPFEFRSFEFKYLDENGNVIDFSDIESIAIKNKIQKATVGETFTLEIETSPETSKELEYTFTTSNSNVAFVSGNVLRFITDGEVTVTVVCTKDKRLTDSMTVTVEKKSEPPEPDKPTNPGDNNPDDNNPDDGEKPSEPDNNGGGNSKKGCKSAVASGASFALAAFALAGAAVLLGRKKKTDANK